AYQAAPERVGFCEIERKIEKLEFVELPADIDRAGKSAVDIVDQNNGRRDRSTDVYDELHDLYPNDGFDAAVEREDYHHQAKKNYRTDDDRRLVRGRVEAQINRAENDRRQQKPYAVGDISHNDKERRRDHFHATAELFAEQLVNRLKFAAEIKRNEHQRNHDAADQISEHDLK